MSRVREKRQNFYTIQHFTYHLPSFPSLSPPMIKRYLKGNGAKKITSFVHIFDCNHDLLAFAILSHQISFQRQRLRSELRTVALATLASLATLAAFTTFPTLPLWQQFNRRPQVLPRHVVRDKGSCPVQQHTTYFRFKQNLTFNILIICSKRSLC
jgi:hypothetical protein